MDKIVYLIRNGDQQKGTREVVRVDTLDWEEFKRFSSKKLGFNVKKVFNMKYEEIRRITDLVECHTYVVTQGEDIKPNCDPFDEIFNVRLNAEPSVAISIAIFGPPGVGKSALTHRFINNDFQEEYVPTIQDEFTRNVTIQDIVVKVLLTDTTGNENYISLITYQMATLDACIFVTSVDNEDLHDVTEYIEFWKKTSKKSNCAVLVLNKIDLKVKKITTQVCQEYATKSDLLFIKTSAKTNRNVSKMFFLLIQEVLKNRGIIKGEEMEKIEEKKDNEEMQPNENLKESFEKKPGDSKSNDDEKLPKKPAIKEPSFLDKIFSCFRFQLI